MSEGERGISEAELDEIARVLSDPETFRTYEGNLEAAATFTVDQADALRRLAPMLRRLRAAEKAQGEGRETATLPIDIGEVRALLHGPDRDRVTLDGSVGRSLLAAHDALKAERDARFAESCAEIETLKVVRDALAARVAELEKVGAEMAEAVNRYAPKHSYVEAALAAFRSLTAPKEAERG